MPARNALRWPAVLALILGCGVALSAQAPSPQSQQRTEPPVTHEGNSPAFHRQPPRGPLAKTLSPGQFTDPRVENAYAMAAKVKKALYQQPCYCYCDKGFGHTSLLSCYTGTHAAVCEVCLMEGIFTYRETKKGKTPGQIRAEILRGEWKTVNLNDYLTRRVY